MKKLLNMFAGLSLLLTPLAFAVPAQAVGTTWDVTGSYVVSFDGFNHDMILAQNNLGDVTGSGGYLAGNPYTYAWTITSGTVVGDAINLTIDYTLGAPGTTMQMAGTIAPNGTMSGVWNDNYNGGARVGTWTTVSGVALLGALSAEDFGVVNYDTGLGFLKGYTAGFGLTDATLADTDSVVVKLYAAGDVLLQTNTAIMPAFSSLPGFQFSSPFDVSGTFDYATDGYWTNVREAEYGQSVGAVKVEATVTLDNGKVVTATNTNLTGDPTTIYPIITPPVVTTPTEKNECKKGGWMNFTSPTFKNQGQCVSYVQSNEHAGKR